MSELPEASVQASPTISPRGRVPLAGVAFALALALFAGGCGGSGKSSAGSTSTTSRSASSSAAAGGGGASASATPELSKPEFVAKANVVCQRANPKLLAAISRLATRPPAAEAAHILFGSFLPLVRAQTRDIQALGVPAGGQATVVKMLRLIEGDVRKIEADPATAGPASFHDFANVAHGYGLTACAPLS